MSKPKAKRLYDILGIPTDASDEVVRNAYYNLVKSSHPDRQAGQQQSSAAFSDFVRAATILRDPTLRKLYDRGEIDENGSTLRAYATRYDKKLLAAAIGSVLGVALALVAVSYVSLFGRDRRQACCAVPLHGSSLSASIEHGRPTPPLVTEPTPGIELSSAELPRGELDAGTSDPPMRTALNAPPAQGDESERSYLPAPAYLPQDTDAVPKAGRSGLPLNIPRSNSAPELSLRRLKDTNRRPRPSIGPQNASQPRMYSELLGARRSAACLACLTQAAADCSIVCER